MMLVRYQGQARPFRRRHALRHAARLAGRKATDVDRRRMQARTQAGAEVRRLAGSEPSHRLRGHPRDR